MTAYPKNYPDESDVPESGLPAPGAKMYRSTVSITAPANSREAVEEFTVEFERLARVIADLSDPNLEQAKVESKVEEIDA